nr:oxidoreductase [Budvicia sp.]
MLTELKTITLLGAGGKMGMRISDNLQKSQYQVFYCETAPQGQQRVKDAGREVTDADTSIAISDVVILAVPDIILQKISSVIVPKMKPGAILLTLDPAASYANLIAQRADILYAVAHPCHPSVFLERYTKAEYDDAFGGVAAVQSIVAAFEQGTAEQRSALENIVRQMYA